MIERGSRYSSPKTPREERLCHSCSSHLVEDELHFLYVCPLYDKYRKDISENWNYHRETHIKFSRRAKFDSMFNSTNADIIP